MLAINRILSVIWSHGRHDLLTTVQGNHLVLLIIKLVYIEVANLITSAAEMALTHTHTYTHTKKKT